MTLARVRGIKRYRAKGRWYAYHRATGVRIDEDFGSAAFFLRVAELDKITKPLAGPQPGSLGLLLTSYKGSLAYSDLAASTRVGYARMMGLIAALNEVALIQITPESIARLRDKLGLKHGRRQANYVLAVLSVAFEHGKERGLCKTNPVSGIKKLRRQRDAPKANRPWTASECVIVLRESPWQLRVPIALAMFTGLRKGDVLSLLKNAVGTEELFCTTGKTGQPVRLPLHPALRELLSAAPPHCSQTLAATSRGLPWTESGFNSSFIKLIRRLEVAGLVGVGLTFHGLRHTVGTLLIEAGCDIDTVRRWLGQKTLAMAIHYSKTADVGAQLREALVRFNPLTDSISSPVSNSDQESV